MKTKSCVEINDDSRGTYNIKTYDNIWKIPTDQGDHYETGCLLDYPHFKENYEMITINLIKNEATYADPVAIQQINFHEI